MRHAYSTLSSVALAFLALLMSLSVSALAAQDPPAALVAPASRQGGSAATAFTLSGLSSPATVAGTIFVDAPSLPVNARVTYLLDSQPVSVLTQAPFWLGGQKGNSPLGFSVDTLAPGKHLLRATATVGAGKVLSSPAITLDVILSANPHFSRAFAAYANQPSAQANSVATMLQLTSTPGDGLSPAEFMIRQEVLSLYKNWGIDPALDSANDRSTLLLSLNPSIWAPPHPSAPDTPSSLLFSPDSPFFQAIPSVWPRVALPQGYFAHLQLNTNQQGDGIGFGEVTALPSDPDLPIKSQWFHNAATRSIVSFPMPATWYAHLPTEPRGDLHMIFIAPQQNAFVSSYKTSVDSSTGGPDALYAGPPTSFASLGDHGGSIAAGFAELPAMLQPGEAVNLAQPIRHALGGPVARVWAARVYPAYARDDGMRSSPNPCTHQGIMNTGLIPYGGVIQLDPTLSLSSLKLTLPARRILEAIQTYGYYVMDFGCTDIDIYTAIPETELDPFGGLWGYNKKGIGVQNEVEQVLLKHTLYVVAPLIKKQ